MFKYIHLANSWSMFSAPKRNINTKTIKNVQLLKIGLKPTHKCQTHKTNMLSTFWGDVGIKKWSPFFCFGIQM